MIKATLPLLPSPDQTVPNGSYIYIITSASPFNVGPTSLGKLNDIYNTA